MNTPKNTPAGITIDIKTLFRAFLESEAMESQREGVYGNDGWINDPERRERIEEAAEEGAEGSTHAEIIDDWRGALPYFCDYITEAIEKALDRHIDEIEAHHEAQGTLHNQIG